MPTARKPWASRWPWERWYSPGISKKLWTLSKAIFDISASHSSPSKPAFEMAEAAFAAAIFVGLQLAWDSHTSGWGCGYPGTRAGGDFTQVPPTQLHRGLRCESFYEVYGYC